MYVVRTTKLQFITEIAEIDTQGSASLISPGPGELDSMHMRPYNAQAHAQAHAHAHIHAHAQCPQL